MDKKIKIKKIKNRWTGKVLFEYEKEDNTIKDTVVEAARNHADLRCADLRCADLSGADLRCADLRCADLSGAYLSGADLSGAKDIPYIHLACPSDGEFIGWKKADGYLVKLLIPADAKRSSATTNKCRCDKAKVLDILNLDGTPSGKDAVYTDGLGPKTEYRIGEMVYPDSFDENRYSECSHGIHFFVDKQSAIDY